MKEGHSLPPQRSSEQPVNEEPELHPPQADATPSDDLSVLASHYELFLHNYHSDLGDEEIAEALRDFRQDEQAQSIVRDFERADNTVLTYYPDARPRWYEKWPEKEQE